MRYKLVALSRYTPVNWNGLYALPLPPMLPVHVLYEKKLCGSGVVQHNAPNACQ